MDLRSVLQWPDPDAHGQLTLLTEDGKAFAAMMIAVDGSGCFYTALQDPEDHGRKLVIVCGSITQLRDFYAQAVDLFPDLAENT